ncbi:thiol reductant ABC exporter subunit CydD [Streptomyces anulatus]|uniref:Thiol reductant ABC exporter subunit CydD n=1 Tax=Streptomyces anulatus TaxID=1892 RepID=A0A7K3R616_STRAQ|nr:thiol reductant ABC exporter subunit CydD [Streptomyces anulatus]NEB97619.1 thiol reductant ABC exporter subunit CydD [Streptomyces anulatus]NED24129.1 thiol reductant ABC exporter subunit CydD [Streptomyces anulatus]
MKPVERRLMRELSVLRRHMTYSTALSMLGAGTVVAQAVLLATVLADGFAGRPFRSAPLVALGAVMALRALLVWARGALAQLAAADAKRTLRDRITERLRQTGPQGLADRRHGETITLLTRGLDALDPYVVGYLPTKAAVAVVPLAVVGWLLWTDWSSALIIIVTLPLIPVFGALVGMHTARRTARQWRLLATLGGHFLDVVAGLPTLRAFGRERHQARVVGEMADAHRRATMRTLRVAFLSSLVLETVATLSVAMVAVPVGLRLLGGGTDLRTALIVLFLAPEAYLPLRAAGAAFHDSAEGITVAERVFAILDEDGASPPRSAVRVPAPGARTAHLRLDRVTVHYADRAEPALRDLSLSVAPGEHVALVGPSGAGKSTLLALLLGFVRPDSGRVTVDGADLADLDPDSWHAQVAWVPQRPHLFAASVAENIRLGRPDASDAEVRRAARAASADLFVEELPLGYDTPLGEHGAGLSAGQRQRIALARAFLKDAPVLLLDEPTAHLDSGSEAAVTRATARLMRGRTSIVVAHRTGLLPHADRIVTVRAGSLAPTRPAPAEGALAP